MKTAITPTFRQPDTYLVQSLLWSAKQFPHTKTYQNTTKNWGL